MNSIDAVNILESCIKELNSMSEEEFQRIKIEREIKEKKYLNRSYLQGDVQLVLPGTSEYNKCFEEEIFSNSISIDYNESFQINFEFEIQGDTIDDNMACAA